MTHEKLAMRPDWISEGEWNDLEFLKRLKTELIRKAATRTGDPSQDESRIRENTKKMRPVTERLRELNHSLPIPIDGDDKAVRMHSLEDWDRGIQHQGHRVHLAASSSSSTDPSRHNLAILRLHRLIGARHAAFPDAPPVKLRSAGVDLKARFRGGKSE